MDKRILEIVNNFELWRGNSFTLAQEVAEMQKQIIREKLVAEGFPEAAEAV